MGKLVAGLLCGLMILAALPASALASAPPKGVPDQSNTVFSGGFTNQEGLGQTFLAGKTGMLTTVELYMKGTAGYVFVGLCNEDPLKGCSTFSDAVTPGAGFGWVQFNYSYPQLVVKGTRYSLVFYVISLGPTGRVGYSNTDTYSAGRALVHNPQNQKWELHAGIDDFMFQTFVQEQTASLKWDKTQISAGLTTPLTLTETFAFPAYYGAMPDVGGATTPLQGTYSIQAGALPSWFTPTHVTCSSQIATKNCTLANTTGAGSVTVNPDGNPVTITITGSAKPAATGGGTNIARAGGCAVYGTAPQLCVEGTAAVALTGISSPTPRVTLPPTSSRLPGGESGIPAAMALLMASLAAAGSAVALALRRSRR